MIPTATGEQMGFQSEKRFQIKGFLSHANMYMLGFLFGRNLINIAMCFSVLDFGVFDVFILD